MKKIAFITSGLLPMPAVKDGAIEMLLQNVIDLNEKEQKYYFDIYSIDDKTAELKSKEYKNTKFVYIKVNKFTYKVKQILLKIVRKLKLNNDPNFQSQFIKKVYKEISKKKYDNIIILSENHFTNFFLKKGYNNIVLYLHNDKLNKNVKNAKFISENCYEIWVVSNYLKNQVLTIDKRLNSKIKVIINGIDLTRFENIVKENHKKINYLYVGRIEKEKGVLELIKAFNKIKDRNRQLYIVGGIFHSSNKKNKYFNEVMNETKKSKNKIYFLGYVKNENLREIYKIIDVQVVPSLWQEPAGLVNIEAICAGVKLIVSDVGGVEEYINNNAILVKKDKEFINNLYNALINYDKENNRCNKKFDLNYYSKEEYSKRVIKAIKELGDKE